MGTAAFLLLVIGLGLAWWLVARGRAWAFARSEPGRRMAALPSQHGWFVAMWAVVPMLLVLAVWGSLAAPLVEQAVLGSPAAADIPAFGMQREAILGEARAVASGQADAVFQPAARALVEPYRSAQFTANLVGLLMLLIAGVVGGGLAFLRVKPDFRARTQVEKFVMGVLLAASMVAILTTLGIFASLVFETARFFGMVSPLDFLFGTQWNPDPMSNAATPDGSRYGAIPLFWGTIFIGAIIAMVVAIPLGLLSAIYLTQYAPHRLRAWVKPLLEMLAGVPTVVYGYFAALTVAPAIRDAALALGISNPSSESALAAGLVMGIMIIPFVSSMADDSIAAVPQAMRDGSLALGATTNETIRKVLVPAALPGIVAGVMLAVSRAIGETMIVVMAAGATARLSANPFESMTTVTFQIVQLLTGDQEFNSPKTLSAFALGLVLFIVTLALNIVALRVVKKYREAYD